jgi:MFS family permease
MINYMDRSALSVAAPLVTKDLQLDAAQLGIFSSFFVEYALVTLIGKYASDLFGPKGVFVTLDEHVVRLLWFDGRRCGVLFFAGGACPVRLRGRPLRRGRQQDGE